MGTHLYILKSNLQMLRLQCANLVKKRRIVQDSKPLMPKAGPDTSSKSIKSFDVWWVKLTKFYQATPVYKFPVWIKNKINNLPPYVDRSTLGILVFTSIVFGIIYGKNEYLYQTQSKLHTENNYPFEALKLIESDMRLRYAFGGEIIFDGISRNGASEYEENAVDGTIIARCFFDVKGVNDAKGRVAVEAKRDSNFDWTLQRVYLDFFRNEKAKPLFIQILPVIVTENNEE